MHKTKIITKNYIVCMHLAYLIPYPLTLSLTYQQLILETLLSIEKADIKHVYVHTEL